MSRRFAAIGVLMVLISVCLSVLPADADEKPNQVQKVTFLGAKHLKPDDLQDVTGVHAGMPLNPQFNREGCRKILDRYEAQGRSFASCELIKGGQLGDTEVVYQIVEGPKIKVRDIQFTGNTFVSGACLATQFKSSRTLYHVLGGSYNSKMAKADIHELMKYFKKFGYEEVRVSLETQRSEDGGEVTLIFHIHEGPRYTEMDFIPQVINTSTGDKVILRRAPQFPEGVLTYPDPQKDE